MNKHYTTRNIQQSLRMFMDSMPTELFNRLWPTAKAALLQQMEANMAQSPKSPEEYEAVFEKLKYFILKVECALRKPVFSNVWWNSLGLTKLQRNTSNDRDKRQKSDARRKKEDRVSAPSSALYSSVRPVHRPERRAGRRRVRQVPEA